MNNPKAAKNLLNETSCYQCQHYRQEMCQIFKKLPDELKCNKFKVRDNRLYVSWSLIDETDLKEIKNLDIEKELFGDFSIEVKNVIDNEIKKMVNKWK